MNKYSKEWPRVKVGGVCIDGLSLSQLLKVFDFMVASEEHHFVSFCDAHLCIQATQVPKIRNVLKKSSLVLPDGVAMVIGAFIRGVRISERLPGPMVMLEYCRHGITKRLKHFFYGGADDVSDQAKRKLEQKIPGLEVVGTLSPPFRSLTGEEELEVKEKIEQSGADVLWLGLGAPKQDLWMEEHVGKINVPLMIGVGAAFDFHSGKQKRAPMFIRKMGMEWFYRMTTGGRRVFLRNAKYDFLIAMLLARLAVERIFQPNTE
jgi:N-acetylglucosaminyldiphosphoundecaprenol N-acetyl-beta-D-mannosaminyltransferase